MHKKTILELHDDLKNNKVTPKELIMSSQEHITSINPKINAINNLCDKNECEIEIDGYLAGIPYAMKDIVATKGIVTTSSSKFLENFVPVYSASIYDTLQNNKAMMVAKANLDEFGMGGNNLNSVHGLSKNPYNIQKGTGGSSGGSAGLVSAGCVPFSIGTDTGDSVRKPAAYCGIYGYKPTWSTISRYGVFPYASSFDQVGIFSRCIDDIAIVLEELNGPDTYDTTTLNNKKQYFFKDLKSNSKKLKIGYISELINTFDNKVVLEQFEETKEYLKSLNHEVVELHMPIELLRGIRGCYHAIVNAETSSNSANLTGICFGEQVEGIDVNDSIIKSRSNGFSKYSKARIALGALSLKEEHRDKYYEKAKKVRTLFINHIEKLFEQVDIMVAPSANSGAFHPESDISDASADAKLVAENHLSMSNIVGVAGLNIPTHMHQGLPYGHNFTVKPFNDQLLLDFGKQFEDGLLKCNYKNLTSFYNVYAKEVK